MESERGPCLEIKLDFHWLFAKVVESLVRLGLKFEYFLTGSQPRYKKWLVVT